MARSEGGRPVAARLGRLPGHTADAGGPCCLAPLVFVRLGELRKAEWADIDLDGAEWRYMVTKTDMPHIVPLSRQAVEILRELYPLTVTGRYVFPNARYPSRSGR